ncbi:MAG: hypothetical protein ACP5QT_06670 [Brevinematia bacterium]
MSDRKRRINLIVSLIFTTLISGLVGLVIATHFMFIIYQPPITMSLLQGLVAGMIIGGLAHISFELIYIKLKMKIIFSFLSVLIVVGAGTFIALYFFGVRNIFVLLVSTICADVVGLIIALILHYYSIGNLK